MGAAGKLQFELVTSDPAPPLKGDNRMVVRVTSNPDGSPLPATLSVTLTMPDHGHPASALPQAVYDRSTGSYTLDPLTMFMAGVWKLELQAATTDGPSDSAAFFFCVEG